MTTKISSSGIKDVPQVTSETEQCSLSLSADGKWMRLIVNGHLTAAFHVNYVSKVLASSPTISQSTVDRTSSPTAEL